MNIYQEKGFINRNDYLVSLSQEHDISLYIVLELADLLGEDEDFDGLITCLQDAENTGYI